MDNFTDISQSRIHDIVKLMQQDQAFLDFVADLYEDYTGDQLEEKPCLNMRSTFMNW